MRRVASAAVAVAFVLSLAACNPKTNVGSKAPTQVVSSSPTQAPPSFTAVAGDSSSSAASAGGGAVASSSAPAFASSSAAHPAPASKAPTAITIVGQGFTQEPTDTIGDGYVSYAVLLANPNDPSAAAPQIATDISVNITFTDATGTVVGSQSDTVSYLLPGTTFADADDAQVKGATHMEAQALVGSWTQNDAPITGKLVASQLHLTNDGFEEKTIGIVKSTFGKDYKELVASAVYYNAAGAIIGGDNTFIDFVPANGTASFSIDGLEAPKGIAKASAYVGFSSLSLLSS
jgi:hypothetical protein